MLDLFPVPIKSLRTSLPGELRLAPRAPSPGWHASLLLSLLILLCLIPQPSRIMLEHHSHCALCVISVQMQDCEGCSKLLRERACNHVAHVTDARLNQLKCASTSAAHNTGMAAIWSFHCKHQDSFSRLADQGLQQAIMRPEGVAQASAFIPASQPAAMWLHIGVPDNADFTDNISGLRPVIKLSCSRHELYRVTQVTRLDCVPVGLEESADFNNDMPAPGQVI